MNRRLTTTDASGGVTAYVYDASGNLTKMTDPRGKVWTYLYDAANQRTKMTDPTLVETTYAYNSRGLLSQDTTGSKVTDYTYDARGNVLTITQGSSVTTYTYDGTGNILTHAMPDGTTLTNTYDGVGRMLTQAHSVTGTTTWTYDNAGRVVSETSGAGTTSYTYDASGRVTQITYPASMIVSFTYDNAGRLTGVTDWTGTHTYGRDDVGRVSSFTTRRGKAGTNTYDTSGRKIASSYYNYANQLISRTWSYDSASRVTSFNSGFGTISYTYTADGRLATRTLPNSNVETYTYDDEGRLATQHLTGHATLTYTYDSQDRVIKVESTSGTTTTVEHRYAYTASGQLETWWYKNDWYRTDYTYTSSGHLASAARSLTNPPAGTNTTTQDNNVATCISSWTANCVTSSYAAEVRLWHTPVPPTVDPSTTTGDRAIVARYLARYSGTFRVMTHNTAGQITEMRNTVNSGIKTFTYDSLGNQTKSGYTTETITYDHANRIRTRSGLNYTLTHTHDGLEYSMSQDSTSVSTTSDYDDEGKLLWLRSVHGSTVELHQYVHDPFGVAAFSLNGVTHFPYYNHRGDTIRYHRTGSTTVVDVRSSPWGDLTNPAPAHPYARHAPLYNGRDGVLPMVIGSNILNHQDWRMGARVYNAFQGRFRQVDPLPGQEGLTDTAYSYASNDPVNRVDPSGMASAATYRKMANAIDCFGIATKYARSVGAASTLCQGVNKQSTWASEWVFKLFGNDGDDNNANAFKHAYGMARIVWATEPSLSYLGTGGDDMNNARRFATEVGNAYEKNSYPRCREVFKGSLGERGARQYCSRARRMDLINNRVGRRVGARMSGYCSAERRDGWITYCIMDAMAKGKLKVMKWPGHQSKRQRVRRSYAMDIPVSCQADYWKCGN